MKFLLLLLPLILVLPAYAEPLSDRTGMKTIFEITVDGKRYPVEIVGNFDVRSVELQENNLTLDVYSSLSNNLGEMQIPHNVTRTPMQFFIDGQELFPKVLKNEQIHFVTLEFAGNGTHVLVVSGAPKSVVAAPEVVSDDQTSYLVVAIAAVMVVAAGSVLAYKKKKQRISN